MADRANAKKLIFNWPITREEFIRFQLPWKWTQFAYKIHSFSFRKSTTVEWTSLNKQNCQLFNGVCCRVKVYLLLIIELLNWGSPKWELPDLPAMNRKFLIKTLHFIQLKSPQKKAKKAKSLLRILWNNSAPKKKLLNIPILSDCGKTNL